MKMFLQAALILIFFCVPGLIGAEPKSGEPQLLESLEIPVEGRCHTQGLALAGDTLFVSCVAKHDKRAYVYRFSMQELRKHAQGNLDEVNWEVRDLTRGELYHPSGLDIDGGCVWVAVAEYHPSPAKSILVCLDPFTMQEISSFEVKDHIGALAAFSDKVVGANWDTKKFYVWDKQGKLLAAGKSPLGFAAQDCKALAKDQMLCGGTHSLWGPLFGKARISSLNIESASVENWPVQMSIRTRLKSAEGLPITNEATGFYGQKFYFIPDDFPRPRLYIYRIPCFQDP